MIKTAFQLLILVLLAFLFFAINAFVSMGNSALNFSVAFLLAFGFSFIKFTNKIWLKWFTLSLIVLIYVLLVLIGGSEDFPFLLHAIKIFNFGLGLFFFEIFRTKTLKALSLVLVVGLNFVTLPLFFIEQETVVSNTYVFDKISNREIFDKDSIPYRFKKGTVYLINFSFIGCGPCRTKHIPLMELKNFFKRDKRIAIITIHSAEEYENFSVFKKYSKDEFHEPKECISKQFNIQSFPTELIIDKKGNLRRQFGGIDKSQIYFYLYQTKKLLKAIADE